MYRRLIIAKTYYQLIMAIQLKLKMFQTDEIVLIITDDSNQSYEVYSRLKKEKLFCGVYYVRAKEIISRRTWWDKIRECFEFAFCKSNMFQEYLQMSNLYFNEVIYFNMGIDIYGLYTILSHINKKVVFSGFEEGVLSYVNFHKDSTKFKYIRNIRRSLHKPNIGDTKGKFYCFHPKLYKGNLLATEVPTIKTNDEELKGILKRIFDIKATNDYNNYEYIFFETSYESDGKSIGEVDLILKVSELIGKEKMMIKMHPRSKVTKYTEAGLKVDSNSSIPFEALQLVHDFSSCVFLTSISGSVLSINAMIDESIPSYLLYPLCKYQNNKDIYDYIISAENIIKSLKKENRLTNLQIKKTLDFLKFS